MPLSICMRCGGEFLPPKKAPIWSYCPDCSCQRPDAINPWTNPERDWSAWRESVKEEVPHGPDPEPEPPRRGTDEWLCMRCDPVGYYLGRSGRRRA